MYTLMNICESTRFIVYSVLTSIKMSWTFFISDYFISTKRMPFTIVHTITALYHDFSAYKIECKSELELLSFILSTERRVLRNK